MPVVLPHKGYVPVIQVLPRGGVPEQWHQPNDVMVAVRASSGDLAVRVDFVGVAAMLMTTHSFVGEEVRQRFPHSHVRLFEHEDSSFVDFAVGVGRGDSQGLDGRDQLRSFCWAFDENIVLNLACLELIVREFDCPIVPGDPEQSRDVLLQAATGLGE